MKISFACVAASAILLGLGSPAAAVDFSAADDPVLFWNDLAIKRLGGGAPAQARVMAVMNAAMHDAVVSSYGGAGNAYNQGVSAPGGNLRAAASVAARNVLVALDSGNTAAYNVALANSLALVRNGASKTSGANTGAAYASAMLALRSSDGSGPPPPDFVYKEGTVAGEWRRTNLNAAVAFPLWGGVTPFLMQSGDAYRPVKHPELDSSAYAAAYNEVKDIGSLNSPTREDEQTLSALFWDSSTGTTWHRIAVDVIADDGNSTLENARIMAKLSAAIADSLIAGFDSKYAFKLWRPMTAIREGDNDENNETAGDAGWQPLFGTPNHPSYLSTHSLQSGAAASVLLALTNEQGFCSTIGDPVRPENTKCFTGIGQAAQDAADSRLWGGIHFRFDNEVGLATGQAIGAFSLRQAAFNSVPEPASWAMMIAGFGLVGAAARGRVRKPASA